MTTDIIARELVRIADDDFVPRESDYQWLRDAAQRLREQEALIAEHRAREAPDRAVTSGPSCPERQAMTPPTAEELRRLAEPYRRTTDLVRKAIDDAVGDVETRRLLLRAWQRETWIAQALERWAEELEGGK